MGSFAFFPLGFVLAGPISNVIGISRTLWISVGWAVASTLAMLLVPSVRNLRRLGEPDREAVLSTLPGEPAEAFHG
jgi:MFS family permease